MDTTLCDTRYCIQSDASAAFIS